MKVLVTGAAGFIGSNFVHYAVKNRPNWEVTVVDSLTYAGNLENLEPLLQQGKIAFERADIVSAEIENLFQRNFNCVIHFAAESHVDRSIHSAGEFVRTNVLGTQNLITLSRKYQIERFVHVSTDEVYGSLGPTGRFTENTPLDPTSPYAASKAASDLMVLAAYKTHKFPAVITRCTNNYGPYQFPEKFIPLFTSNALENKELPVYGDGMQMRSWIHVDDHSRGVLAALEKGRLGEVYNFGGGEDGEVPNIEVAKRILKILGRPESLLKYVTDRLAHDFRYAVEIDKSFNELGWKPQVRFEDGLKATVDWYINNRAWWEKIKSGNYRDYYQSHYGNRVAI